MVRVNQMAGKTFCLCVTVLALSGRPQIDGKKLAVDLEQSVVKIIMTNPLNQPNSIGTGFFVRKGNIDLIATAGHVYLEAEKQIVDNGGGGLFVGKIFRTGPGFFAPVELAASDYPHDLVLLRFDSASVKKQVPDFEIKPLELDGAKPKIGEEVIFMGYFANDQLPILSRTVVAGFTSSPPIPEQVVLDLSANPGQSGGPVLSLESGKVIGILASFVPVTLFPGTAPTHSGLSRSVEAEHLKRLVESADVR